MTIKSTFSKVVLRNNLLYYDKFKIGVIIGNRLHMYRNRKRHFFWKYKGYALNKDVIEFLDLFGVEFVILKDGTGKYLSRLNDFINKGKKIRFRGETQYVLPIKLWSKLE